MPKALWLILALALSGCSAIGALNSAGSTLAAYELRTAEDGPAARRRLGSELTVPLPTTSGALDTDRILVRPGALEASYLPGASWTDTAPEMVQTVLVRQIDASGAFSYVGRRPAGVTTDFALLTELTDLQAEIGADDSVAARVGLRATLLNDATGAIVASRTFSAMVPADGSETAAVTAALDQGMRQVLADLTRWLLGSLGLPTTS